MDEDEKLAIKEKKKKDQNDLQLIRSFYGIGNNKVELGSRQIFDDSQYRILFKENVRLVGFIECKRFNNDFETLMNIGALPKYTTLEFIAPLFTGMLEDPNFKRTRTIYTCVSIANFDLERIIMQLNFTRMIDKTKISRIRFPLDGLHLSYVMETGRR